MSVHHGKSGIISLLLPEGLTKIGEVKKFSFESSCELVDAKVLSSEWDEHIPGLSSWSANLECHFDAADDCQYWLVEGSQAAVVLMPESDEVGAVEISGTATIKSCSVITENAAIVAYNITLKGDNYPIRGVVEDPEA